MLLPAEVELCETVGLSVDEYFHFLALADAYTGERAKEYELVPDVRNDPVTLIITLVIGVALQAIGALLAPKPQEQKTPPSTRTADIKGQSKFAPQTAFDSVQELANLGAIIPLVFTRKGVRVTSQLLWSQMLSLGTGQQLRALMLFSSGQLESRPDFAGFAIGDSLLENYINAKIALYFRTNGGRIIEGGGERYGEGTADNVPHSDAFSIYWEPTGNYQPYFSGTRTPGTQTQFGVYSPMPNGMMHRPDYELILKPKDADGDLKDDIDEKQDKIYRAKFPRRAAIIGYNGSRLTYRLDGSTDNGNGYEPWGTEDIKSYVESERLASDEALAVGDSYMAGTALVVADSVPAEPWRIGYTKDIGFRVVEGGAVDTAGIGDLAAPYSRLTLLRAAVATVSNNRACTCTEIGIKSTVYRQITGFPNVNSYPGDHTVRKYEKNNGSFTLGSLTKYVTRLSFFTLQVRLLGRNAGWQDISGGSVFCVLGNTPQPQYNYIRIHHAEGQYEYRLRPYSGNAALRYLRNREVWQLVPGSRIGYQAGAYYVAFSGKRLALTDGVLSNSEWVKGKPPALPTGKVTGINWSANGSAPFVWTFVIKGFDVPLAQQYVRRQDGKDRYYFGGYRGDAQKSDGQLRRGDQLFKRGKERHNNFYEIELYELRPAPPDADREIAATGGSGSGLTFQVQTWSNGAATWSLKSAGGGYRNGESVYLPGANVTIQVTTDEANYVTNSLNPYDAISDCTLYSSERSSHADNPEHEVVYVNEQLGQPAPQYNSLAIAGLRINSSKEWTNFSSLSAYIKRGVMVERLTTGGRSATNLLPEIAYALLTDPSIGAGKVIGASQVNRDRMALAARFCEANGFTWDGVISDRVNLRQWIYEQAGYCLLDFTILGGQFSLVPSVPYKSNYVIDHGAGPSIKALFTDGNIRKLQVSFLAPEERQLFKAVIQWRQDQDNGFPRTRILSVRLSDAQGGSSSDPEESFDMSGFCTTEAHALAFAKYALRTRQRVDHGVKFETTPQAAMNLAPGEYFRLVSEVSHTSRFQNGSIGPDGSVTCVGTLSASNPIIYWEPGTVGVREATLHVANNRTTQAELFGTVFAIRNTTTVNRVYKVETLSYGEDGLVEVAASHVPLTGSGALAVLDWSDSAFVVETG